MHEYGHGRCSTTLVPVVHVTVDKCLVSHSTNHGVLLITMTAYLGR